MDLRAARDTIERNKAPIVKALRVVTTLLYWVTRDPHYQAASNYRFSTLQAILKVAWVWQHLPVLKELQKQNRLRIGTLDTWLLWKLSAGTRTRLPYLVTDCFRQNLRDRSQQRSGDRILRPFRSNLEVR
jgi:glycerol kinase